MSTKLFDITKQLKTFLSSASTSTLLKETNGISGISIIEAHIQKRRLETDRSGIILLHESSDSDTNCLNIVNIAVAERNRRKGLFTDFLELLEKFDYSAYAKDDSNFTIRIDKVMNPILDEFLPKKGYDRIRSGTETHYSYCKNVRYREGSGSQSTRETTFSPELSANLTSMTENGSHPAP
jgi:hypothetical protein